MANLHDLAVKIKAAHGYWSEDVLPYPIRFPIAGDTAAAQEDEPKACFELTREDMDALATAHEMLETLRKIEKRCAEYEHINLIGRSPQAIKAGTIRNILIDTRAAIAKATA